MPTPPKPFSVLKAEKKSHRTKKELSVREKGEAALSTGTALKERKEVKENPVAHKEFQRINKLLKTIEKNDAIYEGVINRYCLIYAECFDFEKKREYFYELIDKLESKYEELSENLDPEERAKELRKFSASMSELAATIISLDKQIQTKRKMLLDMEKENVMTIAAALRSIPKKPEGNSAKETILKVLSGNGS